MANLPVPSPRTWTVSEIGTGAYENSLRDALNFLINVPICTVNQATVQSVPNAAWTALSCDNSTVDSYGGHSNSTNNSRYVGQVAGWHLVTGSAVFAANATSFRMARINKNGSPVQSSGATYPAVSAAQVTAIAAAATIIFLNGTGDYVEAAGYQNSGGALNTAVGTDLDSGLTVAWLHA